VAAKWVEENAPDAVCKRCMITDGQCSQHG